MGKNEEISWIEVGFEARRGVVALEQLCAIVYSTIINAFSYYIGLSRGTSFNVASILMDAPAASNYSIICVFVQFNIL